MTGPSPSTAGSTIEIAGKSKPGEVQETPAVLVPPGRTRSGASGEQNTVSATCTREVANVSSSPSLAVKPKRSATAWLPVGV